MTETMEKLANREGLNLTENEGDRFKAREQIHPHIEAHGVRRKALKKYKGVWDDLGVCWAHIKRSKS